MRPLGGRISVHLSTEGQIIARSISGEPTYDIRTPDGRVIHGIPEEWIREDAR